MLLGLRWFQLEMPYRQARQPSKTLGGPDSFLAISIRFFTEGIDSVRIGLRFLLVRFEERFDSCGNMGVSNERFLFDINSLKCDSISDFDSSFKFDSITCGSILGFDSISYGSFSIYIYFYLFIYLFIYIYTYKYIHKETYIHILINICRY